MICICYSPSSHYSRNIQNLLQSMEISMFQGVNSLILITVVTSIQVLQENETVDIPNVTLGKEEKGYRIAERVLAVSQAVRTNFGSQSILVLTTYRSAGGIHTCIRTSTESENTL